MHSCSTAHRIEGLKHETVLGLAGVLLLDDGALGVHSGLNTTNLGATAGRPVNKRWCWYLKVCYKGTAGTGRPARGETV